MSQTLYEYAKPRGQGDQHEDVRKGRKLHGAVKEQSVSLVRSGEKATLEGALEHLGYNRSLAKRIFQDSPVKPPTIALQQNICSALTQDFQSAMLCRNRFELREACYLQVSNSALYSAKWFAAFCSFICRAGAPGRRQPHQEESKLLCGVVSRVHGGYIIAVPGAERVLGLG